MRGLCRKRAGTEVHETNGFAGDISEEEPEKEASRSQDIPVSSKSQQKYVAQSRVGNRYNAQKTSEGVCVPCGGTRLV